MSSIASHSVRAGLALATIAGSNSGILDGVRVTVGIELHNHTVHTRGVLFARAASRLARTARQVRVTGQRFGRSTGTRVDVDAFTLTS